MRQARLSLQEHRWSFSLPERPRISVIVLAGLTLPAISSIMSRCPFSSDLHCWLHRVAEGLALALLHCAQEQI
ncbi:hypothetical protein SRHO_G00313100 [Serrasalmus rhombeus]